MGDANGIIVLTDDTFVLGTVSYPGIPVLLWNEDGLVIDEDVSDWLRELVIFEGVAASTALEYAKTIRPFLGYCRRRRRHWADVDDEFLIEWRGCLLGGSRPVGANRVNTVLDRIFQFYVWAERNRRIRFRVGVYTRTELPTELLDVEFAISAKRQFGRSRGGVETYTWVSALRVTGETQPFRHTPTDVEVAKLHEVIARSINAERDSLMAEWARTSGARRSEFANIDCDQIPSYEKLGSIPSEVTTFTVVLKRKGNRLHKVNVPVELMEKTRDYIDYERHRIVEQFARKAHYVEPVAVFLSSTTGLPLHPESITKLMKSHFAGAKIEGASLHRLRATFAVSIINVLLDALFEREFEIGPQSTWVETILTKASEMMGHRSPESLRPYLTTVLNQRIQVSDALDNQAMSNRLRLLGLMVRATRNRLKGMKALLEVSDLIVAGENRSAATRLEELARDLVADEGELFV